MPRTRRRRQLPVYAEWIIPTPTQPSVTVRDDYTYSLGSFTAPAFGWLQDQPDEITGDSAVERYR